MSENEKLAERLLKLSRVGFGYDINDADRKALREAAAALTAAEALESRLKIVRREPPPFVFEDDEQALSTLGGNSDDR